MSDDLIVFTLVNETSKNAVLYTGVATTLDVVLVNNTGNPLELTADADEPSSLTLYLPGELFTATQLTGLQVSVSGWSKAVLDAGEGTLTLTCTANGSWPAGGTLTFPITGVLTTATPAPRFTWAVVPANMAGNLPPQVNADVAVMLPPTPGNLPLPPVLQVSLDNQGLVYCSDSSNLLVNQLVLTLKNVGEGSLATGTTLSGNPRVVVSFVYGNTGGALAPDTADPHSAWSITAVAKAQPPKAPWTPPGGPTPGKKPPQWEFVPSEGNVSILEGVRTDSANVTFVFDQVVTNKVPGHTQMLVLCSGFAKDATTAYDDHLYVLDINKQGPPPTLGVLAFSAEQAVVAITDPKVEVVIPISWTTFGAASVNVLTSSAASGLTNVVNTAGAGPLAYGNADITIDPPPTSEAFFLTLQALDRLGGFLGAAQYTSYLQLSYTEDPDNRTYPIALFGSRYWMLTDYAYASSGSWVYGGSSDPAPGTTRLYTQSAAAANAPKGWELPTVADWQALMAVFKDNPYAALILGGGSRFDANLTGLRLNGTYQFLGVGGYYWTASQSLPLTQFRSTYRDIQAGLPAPSADSAFAVRYVCPA